jgi:predicted dehydrogenase
MRVALYGLGRMGGFHARHLRELGCELRIVDPAKGHDDPLDGIDAVVVASPTVTHVGRARPWLCRGVPVLVEKPLAATVSEARELGAFPHCAVGHIERFNPAFQAVTHLDARFVQAERLAPWADRGTDVDVVLDLMIHDLDLFGALTRSRVREVRANGLSVVSGRIDIVHARVETEAGQVGVFTASRISRKAARSLRIFTPEGYWSADLRERAVVHVGSELREQVVPLAGHDALRAELAAFLGAVSGGPAFPVSAADALPSLELAERIRCACS